MLRVHVHEAKWFSSSPACSLFHKLGFDSLEYQCLIEGIFGCHWAVHFSRQTPFELDSDVLHSDFKVSTPSAELKWKWISLCRTIFTSRPCAKHAAGCVLRFLCGFCVCIYICASALFTCAIMTWRTLLPCNLTLVDFGNWFRRLLCVAALSSLPQLQLRDGPRSRGNVDATARGWLRAGTPEVSS